MSLSDMSAHAAVAAAPTKSSDIPKIAAAFSSSNAAATKAIMIEEAKKLAALRAVEDHFDPSSRYVGIGSGTTIIYVVEAIKQKMGAATDSILFVPTGYQSRQVIIQNGLTPIAFDSLPETQVLDVAFDGADEVDDELNCIKGGGACLFQEKLVATRARKFICVAGSHTYASVERLECKADSTVG